MARSEEQDWRRAAARRFIAPIVIAIVGIVMVVVFSGTLQIVGGGVFAVAVTIAISLVFLEVGLSEDRERERDARERERRGRPR